MGNCKSKVVDAFLIGVDVFPALPAEEEVLARIAKKQESIVCVEQSVTMEGAGADAFARIKSAIMRWDIYGGISQVYVQGGMIVQGAVIGISVFLLPGAYALSFEDVTDINETETALSSQLRVVVTTRQENIVDGNYTVDIKLFKEGAAGRTGDRSAGDIEIYYQKRQNLHYWLMEKAIGSKENYQNKTSESARRTIERLQAFGLGQPPNAVRPDVLEVEGVQEIIVKQLQR